MPQIPPIGESTTATPVQLLELLRPVSQVTPITPAAEVQGEPDRQARQGVDTAAAHRAARGGAQASEPADLAAAVEEINVFLLGVPTQLQFRIDDDSGVVVVSIVDSESGEVLRQTPPNEVLGIAQRIRESGFGLLDSVA